MTGPMPEGPGRSSPGDDSLIAALGRGARRAAMHLVKAGIETLRAVEAVLDEVSHRREPPGGDDEGPVHIPVE